MWLIQYIQHTKCTITLYLGSSCSLDLLTDLFWNYSPLAYSWTQLFIVVYSFELDTYTVDSSSNIWSSDIIMALLTFGSDRYNYGYSGEAETGGIMG